MSSLTVRIPESLHNGLREISKREGVSINQYIALAVTEKMSVINTMDAISERKKEGKKEDLFDVLSKVKPRTLLPGDEITD